MKMRYNQESINTIAQLKDGETKRIVETLSKPPDFFSRDIFWLCSPSERQTMAYAARLAYEEGRGNQDLDVSQEKISLENVIMARAYHKREEQVLPVEVDTGELAEPTSGGHWGTNVRDQRTDFLTAGLTLYSITAGGRLQRDDFSCTCWLQHHVQILGKDYFCFNQMYHEKRVRGFKNSKLRKASRWIEANLRKDRFDEEVWKLYEKMEELFKHSLEM